MDLKKDSGIEVVSSTRNISSKQYNQRKNAQHQTEERIGQIENLINHTSGTAINEIGVFRDIRTPFNGNTSPQEMVRGMDTAINGGKFIFYDIEAVGTPKSQNPKKDIFFTPTEISFTATEFSQDAASLSGDVYSLTVQPELDAQKKINALLDTLESNPAAYLTMSSDEQRSIRDLTKYSTLKSNNPEHMAVFGEQVINGIPYQTIDRQANTFDAGALPVAGKIRNTKGVSKKEAQELSSLVARARSGLANLSNSTITANQGANLLVQMAEDMGAKFAGFNIHGYDNPALKEVMSPEIRKKFEKFAADGTFDPFAALNRFIRDSSRLLGFNSRNETIHKEKVLKSSTAKRVTDKIKEFQYHLAKHDTIATVETAAYILPHIKQSMDIAEANGKSAGAVIKESVINRESIKLNDQFLITNPGAYKEGRDGNNLMVKGQDGSYRARYGNFDNSQLPKGALATVSEILQDVEGPDGEKFKFRLGFDIETVDGQQYKTFMHANSEEELSSMIHGRMRYFDSADQSAQEFRSQLTNRLQKESADRKYNNLFSSAYKTEDLKMFLGFVGKDIDEVRKLAAKMPKNGKRTTEEIVSEYTQVADRLLHEKTVWEKSISIIEKSGLNEDQKLVALQEVKRKMDEINDNRSVQ
ncbi:MAG: hypothetical protein ACRC5C_14890, partial [Bacilli bacterium]